MDFGALPPEMNSARMYAGPGAGSMLGAAAAWDAVADELYAAARGGNMVVAALSNDGWLSQASMAMTAAASTYFAWLSATAARAQQTAGQLLAAASAFESAFAATVPPPVIAANRALVLVLTATNVLGVNTPAIAAAEADYGEMWAQDAAAMYGYAASSAVAATLPEFAPPPEVASSAGMVDQAVAVDQASALASLTAAVPQALRQLAEPMDAMSSVISPASTGTSMVSSLTSAMSSLSSVADAVGSSTVASSEVAAVGSTVAGELGAAAVSGPFAEVGRATSLGQLSVPPSWAAAGPASAVAGPVSGIGATVPEASPAANMLGGLPITAATRGENSASGAGFRPTLPDSFRLTVVPRTL